MFKTARYIIPVLLVLVGCNKMVMESQQMGSIALALSSDLEVDLATKTDDSKAVDCDAFTVLISGTTVPGTAYTKSYLYGAMDDGVRIPLGTYSIKAQNCTEDEAHTLNSGLGSVRYYGETSQPIKVESTVSETPVSLTCHMVNGKISVTLDESFTQDFSNPVITITLGDRTVNPSSGVPAYFNVDADGSDVTYSVRGTIAGKELTYTKSIDLPPAKWAQITIRSNHNGTIGPDINVDDNMSDNTFTEIIDPDDATEIIEEDFPLPTITVDTKIDQATIIDCMIDVY